VCNITDKLDQIVVNPYDAKYQSLSYPVLSENLSIHSRSLSPNRRVTLVILKGFARQRLVINSEVRSAWWSRVAITDTHKSAMRFRLDNIRPIRAIARCRLECLHGGLLCHATAYAFTSWKSQPNDGVPRSNPKQVWDSKGENQKHGKGNANHASKSMGKAVPKCCPS
jgi:hypothetical protein